MAAPITTERSGKSFRGPPGYRTLKGSPGAEEAIGSVNLKSRVRGLRSRVPVQRLFVKIFLWFWLTALVLFVVSAGMRMIGLRSIRQSEIIATFAPRLAAEAAQVYELG